MLFFGLQLTLNASSSLVEIIDPIKTAVGLIDTFASDVKSKSTLVIPKLHISGSPHNGDMSTILFNVLIWGNSFKFVADLNFDPFTCDSVACPA